MTKNSFVAEVVTFKDFANFTEKHLCWNLFLIKLQVFRHAALLKRDSNIVAFLQNSRNFKEHLI